PFLECMAGLLAGVVYGQGVERTLAEQNKERAALSRIHEVVNSSLVLDDVYELFADEVRKLLPSERVTVWSVDPAQDTCTVAWVSGLHVSGVEPGEVEQLGRSPAGEVAESRRGLVLRSAGKNDAAARFPATGMEFAAGIRSILVVPLISRDELVGTLQLGSTKPDAYAPRDVALAEEVGAQIAGAMANSQIYLQAVQLSEERELRARLDAENRELLHLNQEKSRFTSLVSHELRSPLTSILAFSDLLARNREGNLTAGQIEWVNTLRRNGRMMNVLIDDLLSLSRIEAGTFRLARRVFEARRALEEQVEGFAPIVDAKKQSIAVSLPDEPLWVDADPDRFAQVVSNLVSNASKYSPEGSTIELSAWPEADRLHVRVQDHGIGVSREDQRKLFTPFFRAENKATRTETGTGLGLCITKSLVEMHGGRIAVESGSGAGTTIDFHIRGLLTAPAEALDAGGEEHLAPHLAGTLA
ncbi:MAG: HAMP domain-containing histidine kinase, partial [Gemmatimonadetes bacterium]|nr:HAMP domain-containing histidine kinase [Gemmatimonadota bacterium]